MTLLGRIDYEIALMKYTNLMTPSNNQMASGDSDALFNTYL